jgi:hypothetical protein
MRGRHFVCSSVDLSFDSVGTTRQFQLTQHTVLKCLPAATHYGSKPLKMEATHSSEILVLFTSHKGVKHQETGTSG